MKHLGSLASVLLQFKWPVHWFSWTGKVQCPGLPSLSALMMGVGSVGQYWVFPASQHQSQSSNLIIRAGAGGCTKQSAPL